MKERTVRRAILPQKYYFPLTEAEIKFLKQGRIIQKNYSPELEPHKMLAIVAWNKSKLGKLDKQQFQGMRQAGIDVANIPLRDEDIAKIESGDGYSVYYSDFEVAVTSQETLQKLEKE